MGAPSKSPLPDATAAPGTHPSPSPTRDPEAPANAAVEAASQQLLLEISKSLLTGTLATTRGAMQILQGLTGILLASYASLLVGFGKQVGMNRIPRFAAAAPIVFYVLSLATGFGQVIFYRGARIVLGDLYSGMEAYERVVKAQRRQLIAPLILLFAGLAACVVVSVYVLRLH